MLKNKPFKLYDELIKQEYEE